MVMMMTLLHFKNTFHEITRFFVLGVIVVVVGIIAVVVVMMMMMIHIRTTSTSTSIVVVVAGKIGTVVGRHDHQTGNILRGGQDTDQDINGTIIGVLYLFQLYN